MLTTISYNADINKSGVETLTGLASLVILSFI